MGCDEQMAKVRSVYYDCPWNDEIRQADRQKDICALHTAHNMGGQAEGKQQFNSGISQIGHCYSYLTIVSDL